LTKASWPFEEDEDDEDVGKKYVTTFSFKEEVVVEGSVMNSLTDGMMPCFKAGGVRMGGRLGSTSTESVVADFVFATEGVRKGFLSP
jgi:hypothetical protein